MDSIASLRVSTSLVRASRRSQASERTGAVFLDSPSAPLTDSRGDWSMEELDAGVSACSLSPASVEAGDGEAAAFLGVVIFFSFAASFALAAARALAACVAAAFC